MLELYKEGYTICTDKTRLNLGVIHRYLTNSYWAKGIPYETVAKSLENSLNFGLYFKEEQIGFARVVTDYATFMYLADVFILESHRGQKLGIWLIEAVVNHPALQGLRTWTLFTADAHELYAKFGFETLEDPRRLMRRKVPYPYPLAD